MKDELISVEILAYIVLLDKRSHLKILQGNEEGYGMTPLLPSRFPYCTRKTEEERCSDDERAGKETAQMKKLG